MYSQINHLQQVLDGVQSLEDSGVHTVRAFLLLKRGNLEGALQEGLLAAALRPVRLPFQIIKYT